MKKGRPPSLMNAENMGKMDSDHFPEIISHYQPNTWPEFTVQTAAFRLNRRDSVLEIQPMYESRSIYGEGNVGGENNDKRENKDEATYLAQSCTSMVHFHFMQGSSMYTDLSYHPPVKISGLSIAIGHGRRDSTQF